MFKKSFLFAAIIASMFAMAQVSFAADVKCGANKAEPDAECAATKMVCILAMDPPVCKAPLAQGAACKRDKVCASNKCEKAAGQEKGVCK
ncbi:MAG: hypothetical protein HY280_06190 [Nitrospinae bacterium]|nr:hypothetical protein [Nitrospinota bacterium]